MYVVYETLQVNGGRQREVEERQAWGHTAQPLPGFVEAHVLKYLGNPSTYLAIRAWEGRSGYDGWDASEARASYLAVRPQGLYAAPPVNEFFETVTHLRAGGDAGIAQCRTVQVAGGQQARYEARVRALGDLLVQTPGFSSTRTLKFLGNPNRYLQVTLWASRDALDAFGDSPAMAALCQAHQEEGRYPAPPNYGYYEVKHALGRP